MPPESFVLAEADQQFLKDLVCRVLCSHKEGAELDLPIPDSSALHESHGVFVSLCRDSEPFICRGGIGTELPLYKAVVEASRQAAQGKEGLGTDDLKSLSFELDILGPFSPCSNPDAIDPNRHCIHMESRGRSAYFPPRYPTARGWSARGTLEQLCKAVSLPPGVWRDKSATVSWCDVITLRGTCHPEST